MDHDQRFKEMLREFVLELLALFLPALAARLATREVDWRPQELFSNPPLGLVRRVDLLGALTLTEGKGMSERLLNVEVESAGSLGEARRKIGLYYPVIRAQHNLPVTVLAIYLHVGLAGTGFDEYVEREGEGGEEVYRVRWRYVGLPALSAEEYLASDNWLAVALSALMRIEPARKAWLRAEALRRLATECKENDYRKLLLFDCVESYLQLEGEQLDAYERLIRHDPRYQETTNVMQTTYGQGLAEAERKGERKALRAVIIQLASPRCGVPDEGVKKRLQEIDDLPRLQALVNAATAAQSWDGLFGGREGSV